VPEVVATGVEQGTKLVIVVVAVTGPVEVIVVTPVTGPVVVTVVCVGCAGFVVVGPPGTTVPLPVGPTGGGTLPEGPTGGGTLVVLLCGGTTTVVLFGGMDLLVVVVPGGSTLVSFFGGTLMLVLVVPGGDTLVSFFGGTLMLVLIGRGVDDVVLWHPPLQLVMVMVEVVNVVCTQTEEALVTVLVTGQVVTVVNVVRVSVLPGAVPKLEEGVVDGPVPLGPVPETEVVFPQAAADPMRAATTIGTDPNMLAT